MNSPSESPTGPTNFIHERIDADIAAGLDPSQVMTRFPPEPNGYLHIGHAKAIWINFSTAEKYGGVSNLRFDDTNPVAEDVEYVDAIQRDIRWLGFDWEERLYFASDYFEQLYGYAVQLIEAGKAYVDSLSIEEIREYRGNFFKPGKPSPYRERTVAENLDLFARMRAGEFDEGAHVLRAKIDLQSQNMNLRDPLLYRIRKVHHHRTGDAWCIYPMYDFAHGLSDAIEGITHSLCSMEFENHRALYDWFLEELETSARPQQLEFARLKLSYTMTSKRRLRALVEEGRVQGWDDPRMPTLSGLRRRGFTPEAIRSFLEGTGVTTRDGLTQVSRLEHAVREDLNRTTARVMGVLKPLKVVITNYPEGESESFDAPLHPEDASYGSRKVPFGREIYIEQDDFREDAPKKWFRLAPGREIRLRYACLITCNEVIKNDALEVVELRCSWDPESRGGTSPDGRRVRGTSHWVSAAHALPAEVRLVDRLFLTEVPDEVREGSDFRDALNPDSLTVLKDCRVEPWLQSAGPGERFQFERLGYFCVDPDSEPGKLVFNRTISLRDSWSKLEKQQKQQAKGGKQGKNKKKPRKQGKEAKPQAPDA